MSRVRIETMATRRGRGGFSILELMIALVVMGFALGAVLTFQVKTLSYSVDELNKALVNNDIRRMNGEFTNNITSADLFYIYQDFSLGHRNSSGLRLTNNGDVGDCLVLVNYEYTSTGYTNNITKIICYYVDTSTAPLLSGYPLRTFTLTYSPAVNGVVENLIAGRGYSADDELVAGYVIGMSNGRVFYNNNNNSIYVNAKVIRGTSTNSVKLLYQYFGTPTP